MRDQGGQPAGKREGSRHHAHRQHRAQQGGAHGHRGAALSRFEGESHARHAGHRQSCRLSLPCEAGAADHRPAGFPGQSLRRSQVGKSDRGRTKAAHEQHQTEAEHRPIESDPEIRVDRAYRAQWGERRQSYRQRDRQQRTDDDRGEHADQPVSGSDCRAGAECSQDLAVLLV